MARRLRCLACCLVALAGCVDLASLPPPPTEAEQCRAWDNAPECHRIFDRDPQ